MADKKKKLDYDLAFTHLQNNQNITAYNLFLNLAENQKKIDTLKSAVLFILEGECKYRQNKDNANEILEAGKSFLNFAKNENNYNIKNAYLCAAKCFLKARNYSEAKKAFDKLRWNHSYGGKKWKKIADAAIMRLNGEINAVVFVDVVFDIEHHAGHVFDKHNEIDCDSEKLTALLDVKRDSSLEKMYKKFTRECKYASFRIKSFYARGVVAEWWKEIKNGTS